MPHNPTTIFHGTCANECKNPHSGVHRNVTSHGQKLGRNEDSFQRVNGEIKTLVHTNNGTHQGYKVKTRRAGTLNALLFS